MHGLVGRLIGQVVQYLQWTLRLIRTLFQSPSNPFQYLVTPVNKNPDNTNRKEVPVCSF